MMFLSTIIFLTCFGFSFAFNSAFYLMRKPSIIVTNVNVDSKWKYINKATSLKNLNSDELFIQNSAINVPFIPNISPALQEIFDVIKNIGFKAGAKRSIQYIRALNIISLEFISKPSIYMDKYNQLNAPAVLRRLFEELGSTYIKVGQFIASSPTIFPAEYVLEFQLCLDKAPTIPFSEIKNIIQTELSKTSISSIFAYIDPEPLASASIAQVHRAILRNSGKDVVIKVQKPSVETTLQADLGLLLIITKIAEILNPSLSRLSFANIVGDIRTSMLDELDFTKEAQHLLNFQDFLSRNDITDAVAPKPYLNISGKRVLVMEYLKGVPLVDLEGIKKFSDNPEATLITALRTWATSVIENDIFHADVHGGNLLVLENGKVAFIDFGIVGKIPRNIWNAIGSLTQSFAEGNYRGVAKALIDMGAAEREIDEEKFAIEIEDVFNKIIDMSPTITIQTNAYEGVSAIDARLAVNDRETTELILQIIEVTDKNGLKLPREFALLLKQALYFDRYQKLLAPTLDPLRDSRVRASMNTQIIDIEGNTV